MPIKNQSEALERQITQDFEFEGYYFPAGNRLRVCLWEAHKNNSVFDDALLLKSDRFLNTDTQSESTHRLGLVNAVALSVNCLSRWLLHFCPRSATLYFLCHQIMVQRPMVCIIGNRSENLVLN
ncbi:MAG: hypothetical protein ACI8P9_002628 [Parasphingorhabdus sp.]|jgi:hypothetical protein